MCPHCAHFNNEILPEIKKTYIDTGKVFYVFRVFLIGAPDGVAEKLARCLREILPLHGPALPHAAGVGP